MVFAKVLAAMFIFVPATYLRMRTMIAKSKQTKRVYRPSVSIGTDFFRHDFHNGEGLERSDSESDTRRIG